MKKNPNQQYLIKVFTDGADNSSGGYMSKLVKLLQELKENPKFTVVFIANSTDMPHITRALQLDESNTQVHENTGESIKEVYANELIKWQHILVLLITKM